VGPSGPPRPLSYIKKKLVIAFVSFISPRK